MKKLFTLLTVIMTTIGSMSLTSCTADDLIGLTLDGDWEGEMYMYYTYQGVRYQSTRTVVQFDASAGMSYGTGYWVDYYSNAPHDYYASHIRWSVENRTITIHFIEDDYYVRIYDYDVNSRYFSGLIEGEDGKRLQFSLRNTNSQNWHSYNYGWSSWNNYGYGYTKPSTLTRSAEVDSTMTEKPVLHVGKE